MEVIQLVLAVCQIVLGIKMLIVGIKVSRKERGKWMTKNKKEPHYISGIQIYNAIAGTAAFIISIIALLRR